MRSGGFDVRFPGLLILWKRFAGEVFLRESDELLRAEELGAGGGLVIRLDQQLIACGVIAEGSGENA